METVNKRKRNVPQTRRKLLPELEARRERILATYGNESQFLQRFHPDNQLTLTHDAEQCFFGDYPTLVEANIAYDPSTAATWVTLQLSDLSEYCGCKEKLTNRSLEQCAELMAERYYWLKVTELMLFFKRFKLGEYGKFYGSVDPLVIMTALKSFILERSNVIDRKEQQEREAERERWRQEATLPINDNPTYKRLKQKLNIV